MALNGEDTQLPCNSQIPNSVREYLPQHYRPTDIHSAHESTSTYCGHVRVRSKVAGGRYHIDRLPRFSDIQTTLLGCVDGVVSDFIHFTLASL